MVGDARFDVRPTAIAVLLLALSCGTRSQYDAVPYNTLAPGIDKSSLDHTERLGYEIYLRDIAASRGTDATVAAVDLRERGAVGWLTVPHENGFKVRFLDSSERSVVDVSVDPHSTLRPLVVAHDPPDEISPREVSMWRARQLAANQPFRACSDRYNTVVLAEDDASESNWVVYLLAATVDPTQIMLGGHHKFRVNSAGTQILSHIPLTRSCLSTRYQESLASIAVSHVISSKPIETHVYLNHLHGIPIVVVVIEPQESFRIEGGRIRRIE